MTKKNSVKFLFCFLSYTSLNTFSYFSKWKFLVFENEAIDNKSRRKKNYSIKQMAEVWNRSMWSNCVNRKVFFMNKNKNDDIFVSKFLWANERTNERAIQFKLLIYIYSHTITLENQNRCATAVMYVWNHTPTHTDARIELPPIISLHYSLRLYVYICTIL